MPKMNVIVRDLIEKGTCEYTNKEGEVVVCSLDDQMPDMVLSTQEFFRQLRFMKLQRQKKNGTASDSAAAKEAKPQSK